MSTDSESPHAILRTTLEQAIRSLTEYDILDGNAYCVLPQKEAEKLADLLRGVLDTPPADRWQPIETAPKDRRWLLGWHADLGCFVWRDGPGLLTGEDPEPTHWMPLPDPPPESSHD